jgi:hypothetical protein
MSPVRRRRLSLTVTLAMALAAIAAPTAQAGVLVTTTTSCDDQTFSQPFIPWLDYANYVLAPDGGLEAGGGEWTLAGGAAVAAGNEPWSVGGASDESLLNLPAGSSATTRAMCVGLEHPTLRFFARRTSGSLLSSLRADVLFEDATGEVRALTVGAVGGLGASFWQLSAPMAVVANLLPLLPGDHTPVAFRLVPQGGTWQVDDLYVDPYKHG